MIKRDWSKMAKRFNEKPIPSWDKSLLLKLIDELNIANKNNKVLDIGCGTAQNAIALSEKFGSVVAIDNTVEMIKFAKEKIKKYGKENIKCIHSDWNNLIIEKEELEKNFDLVIAHLTPAINNKESLNKMMACSKKYCILAKPIKREDNLFTEFINKYKDIKYQYFEDIFVLIKHLWHNNFYPKLTYGTLENTIVENLDDIYLEYVNTLKSVGIDEKNIFEKLKQFLTKKTVDGKITHSINMVNVYLVWQTTNMKYSD